MISILIAALLAPTPANGEPVLVPGVAQLFSRTTLAVVGAVEEDAAAPAATAVDAALPADPAVLLEAPASAAKSGLELAKRVAVYDLELQGIEKNIGTVVTDSLVAEIRKLQGVSAIGMDEIKDMLSHEANKQVLGCEDSDSCLAEIASALGVDDLITGKLSAAGGGHVLTIRRIDQSRAAVVGVVNQRLKVGSGEEFLLALGPAVEQLFPDRPLREGSSRGVPKEVALRLSPPPLPTWSFWTVAGGAVAVAAAGGLFGILALNQQDAFNAELNHGLPPPEGTGGSADGERLVSYQNTANQHALTANVMFGSAAGIAVAAVVMGLFTDWEGYADQAE